MSRNQNIQSNKQNNKQDYTNIGRSIQKTVFSHQVKVEDKQQEDGNEGNQQKSYDEFIEAPFSLVFLKNQQNENSKFQNQQQSNQNKYSQLNQSTEIANKSMNKTQDLNNYEEVADNLQKQGEKVKKQETAVFKAIERNVVPIWIRKYLPEKSYEAKYSVDVSPIKQKPPTIKFNKHINYSIKKKFSQESSEDTNQVLKVCKKNPLVRLEQNSNYFAKSSIDNLDQVNKSLVEEDINLQNIKTQKQNSQKEQTIIYNQGNRKTQNSPNNQQNGLNNYYTGYQNQSNTFNNYLNGFLIQSSRYKTQDSKNEQDLFKFEQTEAQTQQSTHRSKQYSYQQEQSTYKSEQSPSRKEQISFKLEQNPYKNEKRISYNQFRNQQNNPNESFKNHKRVFLSENVSRIESRSPEKISTNNEDKYNNLDSFLKIKEQRLRNTFAQITGDTFKSQEDQNLNKTIEYPIKKLSALQELEQISIEKRINEKKSNVTSFGKYSERKPLFMPYNTCNEIYQYDQIKEDYMKKIYQVKKIRDFSSQLRRKELFKLEQLSPGQGYYSQNYKQTEKNNNNVLVDIQKSSPRKTVLNIELQPAQHVLLDYEIEKIKPQEATKTLTNFSKMLGRKGNIFSKTFNAY